MSLNNPKLYVDGEEIEFEPDSVEFIEGVGDIEFSSDYAQRIFTTVNPDAMHMKEDEFFKVFEHETHGQICVVRGRIEGVVTQRIYVNHKEHGLLCIEITLKSEGDEDVFETYLNGWSIENISIAIDHYIKLKTGE